MPGKQAGRGARERHRSLRAVIDWSHDLLDGDERVMFRRAGAFIGGFDLDAAVAVYADSNRGSPHITPTSPRTRAAAGLPAPRQRAYAARPA